MRTSPRPLARVAAVAAAALVLQGCGAPAHRYVRTPEDGTGFKIPSSWEVFESTELTGGATTGPISGSTAWLVGFDADPDPSAGHVLGSATRAATDHPTGIARIDRLPIVEGGSVPMLELRNLVLPVDALDADPELPSDAVQELSFDDGLIRDGLRGIRLEFLIRESAIARARGLEYDPDAEDPYVHVAQVAFVAEGSGVAFVLAFMCSEACFDRYRGEIETAMDSWTVLPS